MNAERTPTLCDVDERKRELLVDAVRAAVKAGVPDDTFELAVALRGHYGRDEDAREFVPNEEGELEPGDHVLSYPSFTIPAGLEADDFDGVNIEAAKEALNG